MMTLLRTHYATLRCHYCALWKPLRSDIIIDMKHGHTLCHYHFETFTPLMKHLRSHEADYVKYHFHYFRLLSSRRHFTSIFAQTPSSFIMHKTSQSHHYREDSSDAMQSTLRAGWVSSGKCTRHFPHFMMWNKHAISFFFVGWCTFRHFIDDEDIDYWCHFRHFRWLRFDAADVNMPKIIGYRNIYRKIRRYRCICRRHHFHFLHVKHYFITMITRPMQTLRKDIDEMMQTRSFISMTMYFISIAKRHEIFRFYHYAIILPLLSLMPQTLFRWHWCRCRHVTFSRWDIYATDDETFRETYAIVAVTFRPTLRRHYVDMKINISIELWWLWYRCETRFRWWADIIDEMSQMMPAANEPPLRVEITIDIYWCRQLLIIMWTLMWPPFLLEHFDYFDYATPASEAPMMKHWCQTFSMPCWNSVSLCRHWCRRCWHYAFSKTFFISKRQTLRLTLRDIVINIRKHYVKHEDAAAADDDDILSLHISLRHHYACIFSSLSAVGFRHFTKMCHYAIFAKCIDYRHLH